MTNEEAIAWLEHHFDPLPDGTKQSEAVSLTIKALETIPKYKDAYGKGWIDGAKASYEHLKMCEEEQEPCGDVINRQVAIDAFERFIHELGIEDEPYNYGEMALSAKNVPPVTAEPTGHWIPHVNGIWIEYYECSKCGKVHDTQSDYCEKCGIRMESEGKE